MSEEKNVSKPRQIWNSALKAVKGEGTEQLVEQFTSEMTLVAEGLCEDQSKLRKDMEKLRDEQDHLDQRVKSEQEALDATLRENQRDLDRKLDELTHRVAALETRQNAGKGRKDRNWLGQATILAGILAGAWVLVTVLNLFK